MTIRNYLSGSPSDLSEPFIVAVAGDRKIELHLHGQKFVKAYLVLKDLAHLGFLTVLISDQV